MVGSKLGSKVFENEHIGHIQVILRDFGLLGVCDRDPLRAERGGGDEADEF